jgi:competence protein ComEC
MLGKCLLSAVLGGSIGIIVFHRVNRPLPLLMTALFFLCAFFICHLLIKLVFHSYRLLPQVFQADGGSPYVRNHYFFHGLNGLETPGFAAFLWILKWASLFACVYGGLVWLKDASPNLSQQVPSSYWQDVSLYGRTASPVKVDGDRAVFTFLVKAVSQPGQTKMSPVHERVQVSLRLQSPLEKARSANLKHGQGLVLRGELLLPDPPTNPGAFDYPFYLHIHGITMQAHVNGLSSVQTMTRWDNPVLLGMSGIADFLQERLAGLFSGESQALMQALLLGDRQLLDRQTTDAFSVLGLTHILAISGLHIGLVAGVLLMLCRLLGLARETGDIVTVILLTAYMLLTGAAPSAVRATIMMEMILLARLISRPADGLLFVGIAYCLMLAVQPHLLFEVGFQLSFIVTAGLLLGYADLSEYFEQRLRMFSPLAGLLAVTLIAQAVSFPLLIFYFQQFSPLSWVANLAIVPAFSLVILPFGILTLLLAVIHPGLGYVLAWPIQKLTALVVNGVQGLSGLPWAEGIWAQPPIWWVAVYYLLLTAMFISLFSSFPSRFLPRRRMFYAASGLFIVSLVFAFFYPVYLGQHVRVVFLDVGQGDAAVILTSDRHTVVVDAGGVPDWQREEWRRPERPYDPGERVVLSFLRHEGVRRLDALILTHSDADHMKGALALLDSGIRIRRLILNGSPEAEKALLQREIIEKAHQRRIPVQTVVAGQVWPLGDQVALQWLNPSPQTRQLPNENDASIVFVMHAFGKQVLFGGDVEEAGERAMLESDWGWRDVDILKVAHHGSKTSSIPDWLAVAKPRVAVISVGENNRYGHPNQEVIERLQAISRKIYRTDVNGAVIVDIEPREMRIWSMLP